MPLKAILNKLKSGLSKTRNLFSGIKGLFRLGRRIDEGFLDELEAQLIQADVGVDVTERIIDELREAHANKEVTEELLAFVQKMIASALVESDNAVACNADGPTVIMVVGVNGVGKTTSIAKLAQLYGTDGKKVLLAASDTFRAAAIDQLETWQRRVGVEIVKGVPGADPASVAHDACERALARNMDVVIVDTAGRLHTHDHLMRELEKIHRVVGRVIPGAPHEVLLVLDATTGQNAIVQAESFLKHVQISGIFLAKLDGTAKGGIIVAIKQRIDIPVKFIGVGEKADDIQPFDPAAFSEALFAE
jgi:fused signal recognition particle receptor